MGEQQQSAIDRILETVDVIDLVSNLDEFAEWLRNKFGTGRSDELLGGYKFFMERAVRGFLRQIIYIKFPLLHEGLRSSCTVYKNSRTVLQIALILYILETRSIGMVSKKDLADFIEDFVVETPNWALFGMALLFVFFGWFIDHASFVQRFGGVLVAVILVNAFYSFDVFSNESNKTLIQVMLIFAAVGGLVASEVLKSVLIAAIGDLVIIQVLGIIAVVSRISVNITEAYSEIDRPNPRNRSPAIVFDGRNDTYGMYTAGLIAVILPEILEFLWLGEYFDWMSWVCLLIACTGFGAVYVYRD